MKRSLSKVFNSPWYPLVLSAYPALALLNANSGEVQPAAVIRPLLASIAFGGLLYFVLWLFFRTGAQSRVFDSALAGVVLHLRTCLYLR